MSFTFKLKIIFTVLVMILGVGCSSTNSNSDLTMDEASIESAGSVEGAFDDPASSGGSESAQTSSQPGNLEDEFAEAEGNPQDSLSSGDSSGSPAENSAAETPQSAESSPVAEVDEFSEFEEQVSEVAPVQPEESQQAATLQEPPPPTIEPELTEPALEPPPVLAEIPSPPPPPEVIPEEKPAELKLAEITGLRYRANDSGGTFVIEANSALEFTTRKNETTNQLVIEVPNAKLKNSLQRSINTRDMQGAIGSIDPYQNPNGTTARFVLQLRQGFSDPTVSAEGNSIVVVGSPATSSLLTSNELESSSSTSAIAADSNTKSTETESRGSMIFDSSSQSLEEYLANNTSFSGRKISIEANVDIKEFFKLLTDEIGVNFVISEGVAGNVNIKLKQVPWDQALIVVMKSKKLGYTKIGNILRIAPLTEIKMEEEEAQKSILAKKAQSPLKVRLIPISYAKVSEVQTQITPFLSERGKVSADARTSAIIVTDIDENIERVLKVIRAIDTPTQQVLIEGKIVEASESFSRTFQSNFGAGLTWRSGQTGFTMPLSAGDSVGGRGLLRFSATRIPDFGTLNAALGLAQVEDSIEILSSPRIVTLNNEPANIQQTTKIPVVKSTATATGTTTEPQYIDVKLSLDVTPQVTNDNSVILTLSVNRDIPGASVSSSGSAPGIETRSAKTKVMVKNGQTAVVGGIYQLDTGEGESKIPFLGDVPVLGWLFKSTNKNRKKNELMIFVTPEILTQSQSEANSGTELN